MKTYLPLTRSRRNLADGRGFTLPELMIALTIFMLLLGGIIFGNIFGLKMFQMTETKLNMTKWARETREQLTDVIRMCNQLQIGNMTSGTFVAVLDGEPQQGNGLLVYPTSNTNNFVLYFINAADQTFRQASNQTNSSIILAGSITNSLAFSAQDLAGTTLTNNLNTRVIHVLLEFYQPERFMRGAEYYKLETSIKQRIVP